MVISGDAGTHDSLMSITYIDTTKAIFLDTLNGLFILIQADYYRRYGRDSFLKLFNIPSYVTI